MRKYSIGLALSGGSIKGFAHLGVLSYMEEIGVRPKIIAGTSAGALMGAFYSDGYTPQEIFDIFSQIGFFEGTSLVPKRGGVFSTKKFLEKIDGLLRHKRIEDLPLPLRIVATDLDHGCQHVFTEGPLAECVLASCSVPVLFHPVTLDGINYVDGGLFRNFPVTIIRKECKTVIGVNLGVELNCGYKKTLRGVADRSWQLVFRQNAFVDQEACDILLENVRVAKYGMFEVKSAAELMEIGYNMAKNSKLDLLRK